MSFFQRLRNGLSRFMYGRNGADQLGLCIIWAAILLDIVSMLTKKVPLLSGIIGAVTTVMVLWALFRVFSRNLEKRRAENAAFLQKFWWPLKRKFNSGWTRNTNTSPVPTARPCAACRWARARSSSPAPSAATRSGGKAEIVL